MDSFEINKIVAAILLVALLIIGIGKPRESVEEYERHLYLSKNKLTGDHADINCELEHTLSRYS